VLTVQSIEI